LLTTALVNHIFCQPSIQVLNSPNGEAFGSGTDDMERSSRGRRQLQNRVLSGGQLDKRRGRSNTGHSTT